jgi:hypothetical protein
MRAVLEGWSHLYLYPPIPQNTQTQTCIIMHTHIYAGNFVRQDFLFLQVVKIITITLKKKEGQKFSTTHI